MVGLGRLVLELKHYQGCEPVLSKKFQPKDGGFYTIEMFGAHGKVKDKLFVDSSEPMTFDEMMEMCKGLSIEFATKFIDRVNGHRDILVLSENHSGLYAHDNAKNVVGYRVYHKSKR